LRRDELSSEPSAAYALERQERREAFKRGSVVKSAE
jgi:hypothetical protein